MSTRNLRNIDRSKAHSRKRADDELVEFGRRAMSTSASPYDLDGSAFSYTYMRDDEYLVSSRANRLRIEQALNEVYPTSDTHTHGLDDIACPERLVGECVIEREVAHAVAMERARVAAWLENITLSKQEFVPGISEPMTAVMFDGTPAEFIAAIRNGVHDGGRDDG